LPGLGRQTWEMGSFPVRRRLRRYRVWWPVGLAVAGTLILGLVGAIRSSGEDPGFAGPLVTVCLIATLAGLVAGVIEGLVQPSAPAQLRISMALVFLALLSAAIVDGGSLVASLSALTGSGVALGSAWIGRRVMSGLLPGSDENESE
jgi:hypothetical protein